MCVLIDIGYPSADVEVSNLVIKDRSFGEVVESTSAAHYKHVSVKQPNVIQIEMSFEELAVKGAALVFVCIVIGLLVGLIIGYCFWNTSQSSAYNPVKFVNEELEDECN